MEQRFEMFGMKLSIINQNTTKNIPKNLLKPRPDEKGETCSQQAWKLDDQTKEKLPFLKESPSRVWLPKGMSGRWKAKELPTLYLQSK